MSVNAVTSTGITTMSQSDYVTFFTSGYETIYGSDIVLTPDSPDGQMMMNYIQVLLDVLDLVVQTFNSFDPDLAFGVVLDQRCALNGIQRNEGTFSTIDISLTISGSVNLQGVDLYPTNPYTVQ